MVRSTDKGTLGQKNGLREQASVDTRERRRNHSIDTCNDAKAEKYCDE